MKVGSLEHFGQLFNPFPDRDNQLNDFLRMDRPEELYRCEYCRCYHPENKMEVISGSGVMAKYACYECVNAEE